MNAIRFARVGAVVVAVALAVPAAAQQVTIDDRSAGRVVGPAGRRAQEHVGERHSRTADPAAARRRDRQRSRHRRGQGADRLRQLVHHGGRRRGPRALSEEDDQGLPGGEPVSAVFPGRRAGRREGEFVRRPQGQDAGHAIEGQYRRGPDRRHPEDQRHDLPVACQGEFPGVVHRRRRHDEGRARAGVHARHHGAGLRGHGSRQRAQRAAGAGRRQDDGGAEEDECRLQQAR